MLAMCEWAELIMNLVFILFMRTMIYFLDSLLVIILILGFLWPMLLVVIFMTLTTLFANKVGKAFLIQRTSLTYEDELIFEAWVYNFLIIENLVEKVFAYNFLLLVVLVRLLMFDLGVLQGGDAVLVLQLKDLRTSQ